MENPRPAERAEHGGNGAAWRRNHCPYTANRFRFPHLPNRSASELRDVLAAAAEARRQGDHGAAGLLEADAQVMLRTTIGLRSVEIGT